MLVESRFKKSIATKVVTQITAFVTILIALFLCYVAYSDYAYLQKTADENLQNKADALARDINQKFTSTKEKTELLGKNELIINAFIDEDSRDKYLLPLINNFREDSNLNKLSIVDFDGRMIFQTDTTTPTVIKSHELRMALSLTKTITYFKDNELIVIVPVNYYNTTQGAIVAAFNMKNIINKYTQLEDSMYVKFYQNAQERYSKNYKNDKKYYTCKFVYDKSHIFFHDLGIRLEIGILQATYLQPLYDHLIFLSILGFFVFIVAILLSYALARTIVDPILKLYNRVTQISSYPLPDEYEPLGSEDELERLGYVFFEKTKVLEAFNNDLHVKIQEATKALEEEKNVFSLAIEGTKDGLWDWDMQKNNLQFSKRYAIMLGYNFGDLAHDINVWLDLLHPDDKAKAKAVVQEYLDSKGMEDYENTFRLKRKDGSWCWILSRGKALFDLDGTPLRFIGFHTDISLLIEVQEKLDNIAKHDALTRLPNRFLLFDLLTRAMQGAKRNKTIIALLFIDLDGFKSINDTFGHDAGDKVLIAMANRMDKLIRGNDIASRLGGDEFVMVVTDLKTKDEIIPILERFLKEFSSAIVVNENNLHVCVSIGVNFYSEEDIIDCETFISQADKAMYVAKSSGKNQYKFFEKG
jgi:diguanylate cyclase (GGDEF)-like protein/PAS domain S-box-containing protein